MAEAFRTVRWGESRGFTNALLELVEDGMISKDILLEELLSWMSEDEVELFCTRSLMLRDDDNEPVIRREDEEDEDADEAALDDFNYVGSRHHY